MMKKLLAIALVLCLALTLPACGPKGGDTGGGTSVQEDGSGDTSPATIPVEDQVTAPGEAYNNFLTPKSIAIDCVSNPLRKVDPYGTLGYAALVPFVMIDVPLIPLQVVGVEGGAEMLGMMDFGSMDITDVKMTQNGNVYTATYKDEGESVVLTCEYDPGTDSIKASVEAGGAETVFFEYVRAGDDYAAQYYALGEEGEYQRITAYFNWSGMLLLSVENADQKPASIYKKTGLTASFVPESGSCISIVDRALKVVENGDVMIALKVLEDGEVMVEE